MLTEKQHKLLSFITTKISKNGVSPSFDEMRQALDLRSKSGIHRLISGLEERGFIRKLPHRARALEVIKLPKNLSLLEQNIGQNISSKMNLLKQEAVTALYKVPLMGRISAGSPIEAIQDHTQDLMIPTSMMGKGHHYALKVSGDSMIEEGINNGDTVLIKKQEHADNGDIVVALIENEEVTLKRFQINNNIIILKPANRNYADRTFPAEKIQIQGRLVGLLRTY